MELLPVTPGVDRIGAGQTLPKEALQKIRADVQARDNHTCRFCAFRAAKYQEIHCLDEAQTDRPDRWVTACVFCHQCFRLDAAADMQSAALIWLPEISQADLNNLCRAIYIGRITQGEIAETARAALDVLMGRQGEMQKRFGTGDIKTIVSVLKDFLEDGEYKRRADKFEGVRVLPLDRRIIREGDLEFNQFPQILAYWRSKEGPYGEIPPRNWAYLLKNMRDKIAA